jgi:hypothetical protein
MLEAALAFLELRASPTHLAALDISITCSLRLQANQRDSVNRQQAGME